jgi:hypothetical protein
MLTPVHLRITGHHAKCSCKQYRVPLVVLYFATLPLPVFIARELIDSLKPDSVLQSMRGFG